MKIKTGDTVTIIAGNDRGKTGKVLKSLPKDNKVVVEGINIKAKHKKGENGGIIRSEHPIHASNVVVGDKSKKAPAKKTPAKKAESSKSEPKKTPAKKTTTKASADKKSDKKVAAKKEAK